MVVDTTRADELDWIKLRQDMDQDVPFESFLQKARRKFSESPMIPIGEFNLKNLTRFVAATLSLWADFFAVNYNRR